MHIKTLLLTAIAGTAYAVPAADSLVKRTPQNTCGDSFFFDLTTNESPFVNDCLALADQLKGLDYVWTGNLPNTDEDPVFAGIYGTCVFGLRKSYEGPQSQFTVVGAQDAIDLIQDSVRRYAHEGRVGVRGAMVCGGDKGTWWEVFHNR